MQPLEPDIASMPSHTEDRSLETLDPRTRRVVELSMKLCVIPSITVPTSQENHRAILEAHNAAKQFALKNGLTVNERKETHYPYLVISFTRPNNKNGEEEEIEEEGQRQCVALVGHLDVVGAQNPGQFEPGIENGQLIARGAADMKTAVATQLVWMAEQQANPGPKPPVVLMLSSCEENGSTRNENTGSMMYYVEQDFFAKPWLPDGTKDPEIALAIVGERTGEMDSKNPDMKELMATSNVGPICDRNRGWRWYKGQGGYQSPHGFLSLKGIAETITEGRELAKKLNADLASPQMQEQGSWRTGFVNSFTAITADSSLLSNGKKPSAEGRTWVLIEKGGTATHSAAVTPDQPATIEEFHKIVEEAMDAIEGGETRLHLASVLIGKEGNFNVVSGGGTMILAIDQTEGEIRSWLTNLLPKGITYSTITQPALLDHIVRSDPPLFGIDLREIPEHTEKMNAWLETIKEKLGTRLRMNLSTINDGEGWICPPENPAFQKLRAAYEKITGLPALPLGKLHGNDGRFFGGKAVVWGQKGIDPHGAKEAHDIASILPYLQILDEFGASLTPSPAPSPTAPS